MRLKYCLQDQPANTAFLVQAPVGSSVTGRGKYRHMVFLMAIGVDNKKKLGKRAGVGAFG